MKLVSLCFVLLQVAVSEKLLTMIRKWGLTVYTCIRRVYLVLSVVSGIHWRSWLRCRWGGGDLMWNLMFPFCPQLKLFWVGFISCEKTGKGKQNATAPRFPRNSFYDLRPPHSPFISCHLQLRELSHPHEQVSSSFFVVPYQPIHLLRKPL